MLLLLKLRKRAGLRKKISWRDVDKIVQLLYDISSKKGVGAILAEGIRHAAKTGEMKDVAIHVNGLDPAGYDPRILKGMGLAYAAADRGARRKYYELFSDRISVL